MERSRSLLVLALLVGCSYDSGVQVTVDATGTVARVDTLHVTVTNGSDAPKELDFLPAAPVDITSAAPQRFTLLFSAGRSGVVTVQVEARAANVTVATKTGMATIVAGQLVPLSITLDGVGGPDLGGPDRATVADATAVDATAVDARTVDGPTVDAPTVDGAVVDAPPADQATVDQTLHDLGFVSDLARPPDAIQVPDFHQPDFQAPVVVPSHVAASDISAGTCDLTLTGPLDTTSMTLDGGVLPAGCVSKLEMENGTLEVWVIAVHSLTINAGATITVTGSRPLVVVAASTITVNGTLDASGHHEVPGPNGITPGGVGGGGAAGTMELSGGGGGGYATLGAKGGDTNAGDIGGFGGGVHGDSSLTMLVAGGSPGGPGGTTGCTSLPGGGGGSVQLTAATSINVGNNGVLQIGGGGGRGGCLSAGKHGAGSGGGSGGALFLEAPIILVTASAILAANGGGGGSGSPFGASLAGLDGQDGRPSTTAALGGPMQMLVDGPGGNGAAAASGPGSGVTNNVAGGGGGAVGRIVLHSRGPATIAGTISPPPMLLTNL